MLLNSPIADSYVKIRFFFLKKIYSVNYCLSVLVFMLLWSKLLAKALGLYTMRGCLSQNCCWKLINLRGLFSSTQTVNFVVWDIWCGLCLWLLFFTSWVRQRVQFTLLGCDVSFPYLVFHSFGVSFPSPHLLSMYTRLSLPHFIAILFPSQSIV